MKTSQIEKAVAIEQLRALLKPGDTVYCVLRSVSRSGMSRNISFFIQDHTCIDVYIHDALSYSFAKSGSGLCVGGCGMDMGFAVVYDLGMKLFPDGFGVPCSFCGLRPTSKADASYLRNPANAAAEAMHGNDDHVCEYFGRNGDPSGWDNDGGYALKQRWL